MMEGAKGQVVTNVPYGVMFHHFHKDGQRFGQGSITGDAFGRMIEFIGRKKILPAREWYERAVAGKLGESDVCLTFDDNLMCQYEVAWPVMEALGLTAFFFIYSSVSQGNIENLEVYREFRTHQFDSMNDFYRRFEETVAKQFLDAGKRGKLAGFRHEEYLKPFAFYTAEDRRFRFIRDELLSPAQYFEVMDAMIEAQGLTKQALGKNLWMADAHLKNLSDKGNMLGLHSYSHPTRMCNLAIGEQKNEYTKNYEHIAKAVGVKPVSMSHPCNSYGADTLAMLSSMGIKVGFCSNMGEVKNRSLLEFPRRDHADLLREMGQ